MARPDRKSWQEALLEAQREIEGGEDNPTSPIAHLKVEIIETPARPAVTPPATPLPPLPASPALPGNPVVTSPRLPGSRIRPAVSAFGRWLIIGAALIVIVLIAFFLATYRRIALVTTYE